VADAGSARRVRALTAAALAASLGILLSTRPAAANGAFPDSQTVLTPADRPREIILTTNFGLITSNDAGQTWTWSCEADAIGTRSLYQLGAGPSPRLYGRDGSGLVFTDDGGCTWNKAQGAFGDGIVADAFPDPGNAQRILAVVAPRGGSDQTYQVLESANGGTTFQRLIYGAARGDIISGVEVARSDPDVAYLVILSGANLRPKLVRSLDGGGTWSEHDLGDALGEANVLLVAIDPVNPDRVFLQVNGPTANTLALVEGGGTTVHTPLILAGGFMTGFVRVATGAGRSTLLVSGLVGGNPVLYRSRDDGATFEPLPDPPRLWGMSERAGLLFGAAMTDETFALGVSADEGSTWRPVMRYGDVQAITPCAKAACQDICLFEASLQLWPEEVCFRESPPGTEPDGSAPSTPDAAGIDGAGDALPSTGGSGCGCALAGRAPSAIPLVFGASLLAAATLARRRRRRRREKFRLGRRTVHGLINHRRR
jgi:hypothetical protein